MSEGLGLSMGNTGIRKLLSCNRTSVGVFLFLPSDNCVTQECDMLGCKNRLPRDELSNELERFLFSCST